MTEEWKPVWGWADRYEVSTLGRVRSKDMRCRARNGGTALRKGRILKPVCKQGRYWAVFFSDGEAREQRLIHDVVLWTFRGPRPAGCMARHLDGDKSNNVLSNLHWGTPQENANDRIAHGRSGKGEKHPNARLTPMAVLMIRCTTAPHVVLARRYGVTPEHIAAIKARKVWKHIS